MAQIPSLAERLGPAGTRRASLLGSRHMIAAGHQAAAHAGFLVLEGGGNAVDAGVAAGLALGVLQSDVVNFAGVAPILIYSAETDEVVSIPGLGGWPAEASADYFIKHHDGAIPEGVLRTVIPAAPAAWLAALRRFGTMSFREVAAAAAGFAENGFPMYPMMAESIAGHAEQYARWGSNAAIYLPGGKPPEVGHLFVQTDLGRLIRYMMDEEASHAHKGRDQGLQAAHDAFYRGDIAGAIIGHSEENGGLLQARDLSEFEVAPEAPVRGSFRDCDLYTCGSWCQGPVLIQLLNVIEHAGLGKESLNSGEYIHFFVEVINRVFADRDKYYGDPKYVDVPLQRLLSKEYAKEIYRSASDRQAPGGGRSRSRSDDAEGPFSGMGDTSYVCVIDSHGNAFSATPSDVSYDTPVVPGLGICPSSRGSQSWVDPGHPSVLAPGKRPRLTPNPALMRFADGSMMPFGTPGGDVQAQAMLQFVVNIVVFGMTPQAAVEAPRFASASFPNSFWPHESFPGRLLLESRVPKEVADGLECLGHDVQFWPDWEWKAGGVCAILKDAATKTLVGAADPRRPGYVVGW